MIDKGYELGTLEAAEDFAKKRNYKMLYTTTVEEDENGEQFITFPDEVMSDLGWKEGDTIDWKDMGNGSFSLTKINKDDKVWVLVECIQQYRMRYMVEAPKAHPEYALDDVTMQDVKEFSQLDIGETIVSHRVVSTEEALQMCDVDNDYCSSWDTDKKISAFFTNEEDRKRNA